MDLVPLFDGENMLPPKEVIEEGSEIWCDSLVGFFLDNPLCYSVMMSKLKSSWKLNGNIKVQSDSTLFIFKFADSGDRKRILEGDPIVIRNKLFIIKAYDPAISNVHGKIKSILVWVQLHNIPLFALLHLGLNWLASRLGKLVCLDETTERLDRLEYAKCMIEIEPKKPLIENFSIQLVDGSTQKYYVTYLWKPHICLKCHSFGHVETLCTRSNVNTKQVENLDDKLNMKAPIVKVAPKPRFNSHNVRKKIFKCARVGRRNNTSVKMFNSRIKNTVEMTVLQNSVVCDLNNAATNENQDHLVGDDSMEEDEFRLTHEIPIKIGCDLNNAADAVLFQQPEILKNCDTLMASDENTTSIGILSPSEKNSENLMSPSKAKNGKNSTIAVKQQSVFIQDCERALDNLVSLKNKYDILSTIDVAEPSDAAIVKSKQSTLVSNEACSVGPDVISTMANEIISTSVALSQPGSLNVASSNVQASHANSQVQTAFKLGFLNFKVVKTSSPDASSSTPMSSAKAAASSSSKVDNFYAHIQAPTTYKPPSGYVNGIKTDLNDP